MAAENVEYSVEDFNLNSAVNGVLVGVPDGNKPLQDQNDLSFYVGTLKIIKDSAGDVPTYVKYENTKPVRAIHQVTIKGSVVWCTHEGKVLSCKPALDGIVVEDPDPTKITMLKVFTASIPVTHGTEQTMTRSATGQYTKNISINALEPRDQFAMNALAVIMGRLEHPESIDDANIIQACYVAYRWANGMMLAAADARDQLENVTPTPAEDDKKAEEVAINKDTLSTNMEKLLYNISTVLHNKNVNETKEGIAIKNAKDKNDQIVPFELDIKRVAGQEIGNGAKGIPVTGFYKGKNADPDPVELNVKQIADKEIGSGIKGLPVTGSFNGTAADPVEFDIKKVAGSDIYKGLPIVGAGDSSQTAQPVITKLHEESKIGEVKKVTEVTEVKKLTEVTEVKKIDEIAKITDMPDVVIDSTPDVNVTNMPSSIEVSNVPSSIEVTGTVSVDNFPESE